MFQPHLSFHSCFLLLHTLDSSHLTPVPESLPSTWKIWIEFLFPAPRLTQSSLLKAFNKWPNKRKFSASLTLPLPSNKYTQNFSNCNYYFYTVDFPLQEYEEAWGLPRGSIHPFCLFVSLFLKEHSGYWSWTNRCQEVLPLFRWAQQKGNLYHIYHPPQGI